MHIEKTDIRWHDNNTVEYVQPQKFIFNREESVGPETDTFRTVNVPYIVSIGWHIMMMIVSIDSVLIALSRY